MRFYLGTHEPSWLARIDVPLFISRRRLARIKRWPRALGPWCMDSGGFTELSMGGRWTVGPSQYIDEIRRAQTEIGGLAWAAPQDWMCEPAVLRMTGLTVAKHQALTVESVMRLRDAVGSTVIPVLQGWRVHEYMDHAEQYARAGIDVCTEPVVGVGTVCRRQSTREGVEIIRTVAAAGVHVHGFGVKITGLRATRDALTSADSMAWSFAARRAPPMAGCSHASCANCMKYAIAWRARLLAAPAQRSLWGGADPATNG